MGINKFKKKMELTEKDFTKTKNKYICKKNNSKPSIVLFYQYWCGYCEMIKPVWLQLEKHINLNNKYSIFSIHGSNATNSNIFDHYNIQGVPTIRYMNKKGVIDDNDYSGNHEVLDIIDYLKLRGNDDKSKPKTTTITASIV